MLHFHRVFMAGLAKEAGCFRTGTAPSANLMLRHLDNLIEWVNLSDEHMLIKSCVFHYELMSIQPFGAGNALVARLWQVLLLYKWRMPMGLPLADAICNNQEEYFNALAIPDKAAGSTKFIEYMLQATKDAVVEYDREFAQ